MWLLGLIYWGSGVGVRRDVVVAERDPGAVVAGYFSTGVVVAVPYFATAVAMVLVGEAFRPNEGTAVAYGGAGAGGGGGAGGGVLTAGLRC